MKKILLLSICFLFFLTACSADSSGSKDTEQDGSIEEQSEEAAANSPESQLLLEDDCVKVNYIEVFEEPSIEGVFYFRLEVENKTETAVTVYLLDPSVNDVSTLALSGVPMTIQPGKKSLAPFFFSYSNLDISSIDELEEISFKVKVDNSETYKEIETSDVVTVSNF